MREDVRTFSLPARSSRAVSVIWVTMAGNNLAQLAFDGNVAGVRDALAAGARPDEVVHEDFPALIGAASHGHLEVVQLLQGEPCAPRRVQF